MALVLADRVKETTTTTGTGTVTLLGAATGFQSFAAIGNGNITYYALVNSADGTWEIGKGTYSTTGPTLTRDAVYASTNGGALVNFAAGTKDIFCTYPAEKAIYEEPTGNVNIGAALDVTGAATFGSTVLLNADPTLNLQAATKQYVDTAVSPIPSGTVMLFKQTAAPTGWTKDTTAALNDSALRVVTGSVTTGGSVAFTTAFASQTPSGTIANTTATGSVSVSLAAGGSVNLSVGGSVSATTLATSQIPSHTHSGIVRSAGSFSFAGCGVYFDFNQSTNATGGGGSHTHSFTNPTYSLSNPSYSGSFTGTAHNHTFTGNAIDLAVKYVDMIIATKN